MTDPLISRLEQATEGSRELDCLIAVAVGWDIPHPLMPLSQMVAKFGESWLVESATEYGSIYNAVPHYTTSLDAAMSLIPEGHGWTLIKGADELPQFISRADIPVGARVFLLSKEVDAISHAPTPALALCIASLKAAGYE